MQKLCAEYFNGLFDFAVGEKPGINKKPSPDAIFAILKELNISKERALFIGDSETDIKTAENAGIDCIAVAWGFRDKDFLKSTGVKIIATNPDEILNRVL